MLHVELVRPEAVCRQDQTAWRAWQAAVPALRSPLLSPEFAVAVGRVRADAAVALVRREGRLIGVLAHHRRPGGLARPIGAPFSDVHALVAEPGVSLGGEETLRLAAIRAFRFTSLADPEGRFDLPAAAVHERHLIEVGGDGAAYLERLRAASAKRFKNWRRLEHKLERERGAIELVGPDRDSRAFELMLHWKRDQLRRSGLHDVYRPAWVQGLMRQLFAERDGPMQGLLLTLRADGQPVAGHFGVRLGDAYHPWVASIDPHAQEYSPGQTFLGRAILAMPGLGLETYDLAAGHDHYKAPFASARERVLEGVAFAEGTRPRPAPLLAGLGPAAQRVGRRLDQIAAVDLNAAGRLLGVVEAARAWRLRQPFRPVAAQEISE
jgi:CelD/BcsL family acetyltransferase involved in cellulose biosynthesis